MVEPMGNETLVVIRLGEERLSARARRGSGPPCRLCHRRQFRCRRACFDAAGTTVVQGIRESEETNNENADLPQRRLNRRKLRRRAPVSPSDRRSSRPGRPADRHRRRQGHHRRLRRWRLTPFKQKIIPLAKSEAGFDISSSRTNMASPSRNGLPMPRTMPANTTCTCWMIPGCRIRRRRRSRGSRRRRDRCVRSRLDRLADRHGLLAAAPGAAGQGL